MAHADIVGCSSFHFPCSGTLVMSKKDRIVSKVVLCGDASVGKTTILQRILRKDVEISPGETMGVGFASVMYKCDNRDIQMNLWDTAGQETYRSLVSIYFKGADISIFVFDVTSAKSFEGVLQWMDTMKEHCGDKDPECLLVCNKIDLFLDAQVTDKQIEEFCEKHNMKSLHVSAYSNRGISNLMEEIATLILNREEKLQTHELEGSPQGLEPNMDSSTCC